MSEMTSGLVERIEAATGPNCDIDAEIAKLQGFRIVEEGHPLGRRCYGKDHRGTAIPAYTRSIDAAVTLVPEGWLRIFGDDPDSGKAVAGLYNDGEDDAKSIAETIPLAICAAALRARAPLPAPPAKDTI